MMTFPELQAHWRYMIDRSREGYFLADDGQVLDTEAAKRADIRQRCRDEIANSGDC